MIDELRPEATAPPVFPATLPGEMWGVSVCFNPVGYGNKYTHLRQFAERVRGQGLKLLVLELAIGGAPYALESGVADVLLQRRSDTVLWHKEALLNLALEALPPQCDKVAWLDADLLFESDAWVSETARALNSYLIVQPFAEACWLKQGVMHVPAAEDWAQAVSECSAGTAKAMCDSKWERNSNPAGHPGFAWAARRSLLERHRFYDRMIMGGGDLVTAYAMYDLQGNTAWKQWAKSLHPEALTRSTEAWGERFYAEVQGSVSYTAGRVFHLWHGDKRHRRYLYRQVALHECAFDPEADVALDQAGGLVWSSDKPELHLKVAEYFLGRKEEG